MGELNQQVMVKVDDQEFLVEIEDITASPVIAKVDGQSFEIVLVQQEKKPQVSVVKRTAPLVESPAAIKPSAAPEIAASENAVMAPMPGDIIEVNVRPGANVGVGDELCVLDAMKMKNVIYSPREGTIADVEVVVGQAVDYGTVLVTFE